jgi:flagellar protein FliT
VSTLSKLHRLTIGIIQLLESEEERVAKIANVEVLLDERETLLKGIAPPYSTEEIEIGKKINKLNMRMNQLLLAVKKSVQKDIVGLQAKKESSAKYVNPYQNVTTDGYFYDKKK